MPDIRPVNPWKWQDDFGFSQAVEVRGDQRVLYCAGQTSVDSDGKPLHPGNMTAQLNLAIDNLETVLKQAGLTLANVVRLNYYTTDVPAFMDAAAVVGTRLKDVRCKPSGTLLGVKSLFHPDAMVEIEATAVA
ncbi:MAG TPA: RidA family protein [Vicinamibacterales bacterium]